MAEAITPINVRAISQIFGPEAGSSATTVGTVSSPFEDILNRAMDSLEGVSKLENQSSELISKYVQGQAELSDVMMTAAKANIAVQLAVTVITSAVNTFKEITQMQV